jgi:hypothetical protein
VVVGAVVVLVVLVAGVVVGVAVAVVVGVAVGVVVGVTSYGLDMAVWLLAALYGFTTRAPLHYGCAATRLG